MTPSGMPAAWLAATLAAALAGCGSGGAPVDRGARVYGVHCASCHQRDGRGRPGAQPALAGSAVAAGDPQVLAAWLLFGERPAGLAPNRSAVRMPPFPWLSDADIAAVLTHVRGNFGNQAAPVTEAEVSAVRASRAKR